MELLSKLSKSSCEISTKREEAAIVLVGFQNRRISLLDDYYYWTTSSVANQNAGFALVH